MLDSLRASEIHIRLIEPEDAQTLLQLYHHNRDFFAPWEPLRTPEFYTLSAQQFQIENSLTLLAQDRSYPFAICLNSTDEIIGRINMNHLVRGIFQSCSLGYLVDPQYNGRGVASAAVRLIARYAFEQQGLHRLEAATLTHNHGSMRVLEKNGFRREGLALRYLKINGIWQDHYIFARTVEE